MAGAPLGNTNAARGRVWRDAIDRALQKRSKVRQVEALDELAEKLIERAEGGDITALKELGDRLEGKPAQQVVLAGDQENPVRVEKIVREVVKP